VLTWFITIPASMALGAMFVFICRLIIHFF